MGHWVRKLVERLRQRLNLDDAEFRPLPSMHLDSMLLEAEDFAKIMRSYRDAVSKYAQQLDGFLATYPYIAWHNLPRVWETVDGHPGLCEPRRQELSTHHPIRVGGDFDEIKLEEARHTLKTRLNGIIKLADTWLDGLDIVKVRLEELKGQRLLVDARRRKTVFKTIQLKRHGARDNAPLDPWNQPATHGYDEGKSDSTDSRPFNRPLGLSGLHDKQEVQREDMARHIMQRQRKLDAAYSSYKEQEMVVYQQLKGLVLEAAWFKSSIAATMLIVKDALQASLFAFGPCKLPLPGFNKERSGGESGVVGPLTDLIQDVPEVLKAYTASPSTPPLEFEIGEVGGDEGDLEKQEELAAETGDLDTHRKVPVRFQQINTPPYRAGPLTA